MFARATAPHHSCNYEKVNNPLCQQLAVSSLYRCTECEQYHICEGKESCVLINAGETTVCLLTGVQVCENFQEGVYCSQNTDPNTEALNIPSSFHHVITSLQGDIAKFFSQHPNLSEIQATILESGVLHPNIKDCIEKTFKELYRSFEEVPCTYNVICSMYIHVIILIYASKTVYGSVLFKCTKNKKYDCIVKQLRQAWMHMLRTGDSIGLK